MASTITGEEALELKKRVKMLVKAILCSSPEGVTERELSYQYFKFNHETLPYVRLGYKSVYDMMKDLDISRISRLNTGQYVFYAIYDEETSQLGALVLGQRDADKESRETRRMQEPVRRLERTIAMSAMATSRNAMSAIATSLRQQQSSSNTSTSPTTTTRSNALNATTSGGFGAFGTTRVGTPAAAAAVAAAAAATTNNSSISKLVVSPYVQRNIQEVLKNAYNYRLTIQDFQNEYIKYFGTSLNASDLGFSSILDLFGSLSHLVYLIRDVSSTNDVAYDDVLVGLKLATYNNESNQPHTQQQQQQPQVVTLAASRGRRPTSVDKNNNNYLVEDHEKNLQKQQQKQTLSPPLPQSKLISNNFEYDFNSNVCIS